MEKATSPFMKNKAPNRYRREWQEFTFATLFFIYGITESTQDQKVHNM